MLILKLTLVAIVSYLLGCFNGAILVSKYILKDDIRQHGSGNAGLTNFYRVFGGKLTLLVVLSDMLKAVIAVMVGALVLHTGTTLGIPLLGKLWAALFVMLGHDFPFMFGFRGGKGVLSGGAVALALDWRIALICWGLFILVVVLSRYVSLGSIIAGVSFAVTVGAFYPYVPDIVLGILCGVLLVWGHRSNILRLIQGKENKFSFHKKGESKQ